MDENSPANAAAVAFKKVLRETGLTQRVISSKTKISQTALTKFVTGRPPTSELLRRLMGAFPAPQAREILLAHLADEITRAGHDPATFYLINKEPDLFFVRGDLSRISQMANSTQPAVVSSLVHELDETRDI